MSTQPVAPKKPSVAKFFLIVLGVAALGFVIVVALGAWWIASNAERFRAEGKAARAEGKAFADGKTNEECVTEALRRTDTCGSVDFTCKAGAHLFLDDCLHASTKTDGLCRGVPRTTEIMKTVAWRIQACQQRGHTGDAQACGETLDQLQKFCVGEK